MVFLAEREGKPLLLLQGAVDIFSAEQLHNVALRLIERDADAVVDCEKAEQVGNKSDESSSFAEGPPPGFCVSVDSKGS